MQIKLPLLIVLLVIVAAAGGGISYFFVTNQEASAPADAEQPSRNVFAPRDPLPTTGGQEMQPRF
ncbi:DUF2749 domain-containing protein [Rhizobium panacihumi]|uniref:DUF2749 domain-containing protein n=1 Tax=Rhizobium panacihumi TaxID=2008450 RepID=UPI003D7B7934